MGGRFSICELNVDWIGIARRRWTMRHFSRAKGGHTEIGTDFGQRGGQEVHMIALQKLTDHLLIQLSSVPISQEHIGCHTTHVIDLYTKRFGLGGLWALLLVTVLKRFADRSDQAADPAVATFYFDHPSGSVEKIDRRLAIGCLRLGSEAN